MVLQPREPGASFATWRVRIENTEPLEFQADVLTTLESIADAGGPVVLEGVPCRYTSEELDLVKNIRPGYSTSASLVFAVDRNRAQ